MKTKTVEDEIKELRKMVDELEDFRRYPIPEYPRQQFPDISKLQFDPECLHNACEHDKNPACWLVCPHCQGKMGHL